MLRVDIHTHTVHSGHAFNTLYELVAEGERRGLKLLGVTEHGPAMDGAPHPSFFNMAPRIPGRIGRVAVMSGVECNILDLSGTLDLSPELLAVQDVVLAGLHEFTPYPVSLSARENTQAVIRAMRNPHVDVIVHPYRPEFPVEVRPVVEMAAEYGVLLEINLSLFRRPRLDARTVDAYRELVRLSAELGQPVLVSSDAHIAEDLADDRCLAQVDLGLTEAMYWNPVRAGDLRINRRLRQSAKEALAQLHLVWNNEVEE